MEVATERLPNRVIQRLVQHRPSIRPPESLAERDGGRAATTHDEVTMQDDRPRAVVWSEATPR
jgi:hypothetical protein